MIGTTDTACDRDIYLLSPLGVELVFHSIPCFQEMLTPEMDSKTHLVLRDGKYYFGDPGVAATLAFYREHSQDQLPFDLHLTTDWGILRWTWGNVAIVVTRRGVHVTLGTLGHKILDANTIDGYSPGLEKPALHTFLMGRSPQNLKCFRNWFQKLGERWDKYKVDDLFIEVAAARGIRL